MVTSAVRRKPVRARKGRPDAPENLTTRVTDAIRQSIVDAEFELGEALTTLQRQGLIVIRPQSVSFVFMPSEEDVAVPCEFRRLIETATLRLAYARADAAFYEVVVENSANRYLIEPYTLASGRVSAQRTRNLSVSTPLRRRSNAAHQAIATAFEKGDLPEAEQLVDEHVLQMAIGFRALRRAESPT